VPDVGWIWADTMSLSWLLLHVIFNHSHRDIQTNQLWRCENEGFCFCAAWKTCYGDAPSLSSSVAGAVVFFIHP